MKKANNKKAIKKELTDEEIFEEMLECNTVVRMPPVKEYTIKVKIESIKKATPKIVEPGE
ncbi:unnamed protein product [marine sediment metagenome]|uniref:Uncharacterized protein n=1 Tax=marine sediment metagenome TaxID=412755 RepID=X0Y1X2_9ZZZZ